MDRRWPRRAAISSLTTVSLFAHFLLLEDQRFVAGWIDGEIHDAHPFFRSISPERPSLSGTQADAGPGAAPATFHSVRAPSFVPRPACDRHHSWSAPTTHPWLLQTTGQNAAPPFRAGRQSAGPGSGAVSPRPAAPDPPVRVLPHRQSAAIPMSLPAVRTPDG